MGALQSLEATVTVTDARGASVHIKSIDRLVHTSFPEQFAEVDEEEGEDLIAVLCGVHDLEQALFLFCWRTAEPEPIGFALLFKYDDALYISTLCIDPAYRRCGLGSWR